MGKIDFDVAIIGGGASGLMTAATLAKNKVKGRIAIIEHNKRTGKKLMATGNGRCNLSNNFIEDNVYYGSAKKNVSKICLKYNCDYIKNYFKDIGLFTTSDNEGRIYPLSNNVSSVLDCLRNYILSYGIDEICETTVTNICEKNGIFQLTTNNKKIYARYVVIACGGKASPKLSTNGNGYPLLNQLNIKTTPLFPSLVAIKCKENYLSSLKGLRVKGEVSFLADNKIIETQKGEIQFTESALSGICVFQLSRFVNEYFECGTVNNKICKDIKMIVNILPDFTNDMCREFVNNRISCFGKYPLEKFFDGVLQKRLAIQLLKECGIIDFNRKCSTLTKKEISKIISMLNYWRFTPCEKSSFENAQVTAGGILNKEINFSCMSINNYNNLYATGEIIDVDGICGGYNLHWAWISGIIAGESISKRLGEKI